MNTAENFDHVEEGFNKEYIVDGSFDTAKLKEGEVIVADTGNHKYTIEKREDGLYVSGHEKYCPVPMKLEIFAVAPNQAGKGPSTGIIWTGSKITFLSLESETKFTTSSVDSIERNPD